MSDKTFCPLCHCSAKHDIEVMTMDGVESEPDYRYRKHSLVAKLCPECRKCVVWVSE
jgi:hypothetical protein